MSATASDRLVLGTALGYGVREIFPFVESLRRHYDGDAALLICTRNPPEVVDYLRRNRVQPVFFDAAYWMLDDLQTSRYVRYADLLNDTADRYAWVMLTDVADVVFQADPFAGLPEGDLLLFLEDPARTIASCPANTFWTKSLYGDKGMALLGAKQILCSDTTIGRRAAVQYYLQGILAHATAEVMRRMPPGRGFDQGIHNFLYHQGYLPAARAIGNAQFVWTLAHVDEAEIAVRDGALVHGPSGRAPAVVHQYPYKPVAARWVAETYAYE